MSPDSDKTASDKLGAIHFGAIWPKIKQYLIYQDIYLDLRGEMVRHVALLNLVHKLAV